MTLLKVIVLPRFLENDEIFKDLIQTVGVYLTSFTVFFLEISKKKKKKKKKSSENDQSTGHFQSFFFFFFFFVPPTLDLKKKFP